MADPKQDRPLIEYPAPWSYKVIGTDEDAVRAAVRESLDAGLLPDTGDREFQLGLSRESRGGRYLSLHLSLTVLSEEERDGIFRALKAHPDVLLVM